ncbi:hypothetical protein KIN20_021396 [Parelaphostrongylus tenuis]|uniref:Metalloendopeptidase n=1 Tax=Parelaphostrongylus tenuis TaxID=148309 RepID=A0AAD5QU60_PARTN|nr:hypothetical protein KIN20_021396 [Parelaphostrongylus tenuis]
MDVGQWWEELEEYKDFHLGMDVNRYKVGTAAHEIGHALGFFHTQSRHDRDSFITLNAQNFMVNLILRISVNNRQ